MNVENLRYFIGVRHGDYNTASGSLTESGRTRVRALASAIQKFLPGDSTVVIVTSPLPRATESANIVGAALKCGPQTIEDLSSSEGYLADELMPKMDAAANGATVLIVVGHGIVPTCLAYYFRRRANGSAKRVSALAKGSGVIVDLSTGETVAVPVE